MARLRKILQRGDFVTYGGNPHVANDNVYAELSGSSKWELVTSGFNQEAIGEMIPTNTEYRIGDVVRLGGYTYLATANSTDSVLQRNLLGKIKPVLNGKYLDNSNSI